MKKPWSLYRFARLFAAVAILGMLLMISVTVIALMGGTGASEAAGSARIDAKLGQTLIDFFIALSYFFAALSLLCFVAGFFNKPSDKAARED